MINERVFLRLPLKFEKDVVIYPPTVNDVVGDPFFHIYHQFLTMTQEDIECEIIENYEKANPTKIMSSFEGIVVPTPFEYLLIAVMQDKRIETIVKQGFERLLHQPVSFIRGQRMIIIGDTKQILEQKKSVDEIAILNADNYFKFQNIVRQCCGDKEEEPPRPDEHFRIKKMRVKSRQRDKVKAKQDGISLATTLVAICCMNLGLTPLNIGEISYASVSALMRMSQNKEKYEIDIQSMLAGAKNVKVKQWIRDYDKDKD